MSLCDSRTAKSRCHERAFGRGSWLAGFGRRSAEEYVLGSRLLLLLCSLVLTSLLTFARPLIIKGITDEGMLQADMRMVLLCAMLLLLSAVCDQAVNIVQSRQFVDIQNSMLLALYRAAFDKLLRVKQDYFTHHNSAEIMNRLSMDIRSVSMIADRSILFVASYLLSFVGGLVGLCPKPTDGRHRDCRHPAQGPGDGQHGQAERAHHNAAYWPAARVLFLVRRSHQRRESGQTVGPATGRQAQTVG